MFTAEPHSSLNFSKPNLSIVWHEVRKAGSAESEKVSNPAQGDSLPSFITAMNERLFQASPQSLGWLCFPALIACEEQPWLEQGVRAEQWALLWWG